MFDPLTILHAVADPALKDSILKGVADAKAIVADVNALIVDVEAVVAKLAALKPA
jgi:hypothetical protein